MTETEARTGMVTYWFEKARESLDSARAELAAGRHSFAVNRCYYACFYAACAVFLYRGTRFVKHSGVRTAFHRDLVRTGELSEDQGRVYDRLFTDRHEGDYVDFAEFTQEEASEDIVAAETLVGLLEELAQYRGGG